MSYIAFLRQIMLEYLRMNKTVYENRALYLGVLINLFSGGLGFAFYFMTKFTSLLLDGLVSAILCFSTITSLIVLHYSRKKSSVKYPLGRYAIENLFMVFRSLMLLVTIVFTLYEGISTILSFYSGSLIGSEENYTIELVIYGISMIASCLAITFIYSHYSKKVGGSMILTLEIKASIYDGLVTLFAISSLLIFSHVSFLAFLKDIGDAITTIILSLIYLVSPIKELISQFKILTDKRRDEATEEEIYEFMKKNFPKFVVHDIYYSDSGQLQSIYISMTTDCEFTNKALQKEFSKIQKSLKKAYPPCKVYLLYTDKPIHAL